MNEEFKLGQVFEGIYPPEAAQWCNEGQMYHIDEVDPNPETGERRFEIVKNEVYEPTPEELAAMEAQIKAAQEQFIKENHDKLTAVRKMGLTDDEAKAMMSILPLWDETEQYEEGDYVVYGQDIYRAKWAHDNKVPDTESTYWEPVTKTSQE